MSTVKERPILFSGPMVRAILDGKKTQTRRVVKPQSTAALYMHNEYGEEHRFGRDANGKDYSEVIPGAPRPDLVIPHCPYGKVGDRLWVREAYKIDGAWVRMPDVQNPSPSHVDICYAAGPNSEWHVSIETNDAQAEEAFEWYCNHRPAPMRPSIHMPRWASRITLEITDVRVERVQDISETDAITEGCNGYHMDTGLPCGDMEHWVYPQDEYAELWDSINGKRTGASWTDNPWVWVVSFKRVEAAQ